MAKSKLGIVGGCGSSGSTLLTHLLSRSPDICSGPEFNCFNHNEIFNFPVLRSKYRSMFEGNCPTNGYIDVHVFMTFCDDYGIDIETLDQWIENSTDSYSFVAKVCSHMTDRTGTSYFIEKSPSNVYCFKDFVNTFPELPLIHIIRDGRDVVTSLMKRDFNLFGAGSRWLYDTLAGLCGRGSKSYIEIRYEDLVHDPVGTLQNIFNHLKLPFDPIIVQNSNDNSPGVYVENWKNRQEPRVWKQTPSDPISTASVGRYKRELQKDDLSTLYRIKLTDYAASKLQTKAYSFGELLQLLDYDLEHSLHIENVTYKQRAREMKYEFQDYCRRANRFWNRGYIKLPYRYTYIDR